MEGLTDKYTRVHAIVVDPYHRVLLINGAGTPGVWSASFTRALIMTHENKVIINTVKALLDLPVKSITIEKLWDVTLDEIKYVLCIVKLFSGFTIKHGRHINIEFIPVEVLYNIILEEEKQFTDDTVRVMAHLSSRTWNK